MGHTPGFPCLHSDPNHEGRCSTPVSGAVVDPGQTRYYELGNGDVWRVNPTARYGCQVEYRGRDRGWHGSVLPTVEAFEADIAGATWRELTAEEVNV